MLLGVKRFTNNIKVLPELGRTPFKTDIETKYFQSSHLLKRIDTYSKPSKKKNLIQKAGFRI